MQGFVEGKYRKQIVRQNRLKSDSLEKQLDDKYGSKRKIQRQDLHYRDIKSIIIFVFFLKSFLVVLHYSNLITYFN